MLFITIPIPKYNTIIIQVERNANSRMRLKTVPQTDGLYIGMNP